MREAPLGGDVKAAFAVAVVLGLIAGVVDNGPLGWALAPGYVGGLLYAAARAPLRYSLYVLMFLALTLEKPTEMPVYPSMFAPIGTFFFLHLKNSTGVGFLFLSGMEYMLIFLCGVAASRHLSGSKVDARGRVATPRPLVRLAYVSLLGSAFTWLLGLATGGDFSKSLWQLEKVIYLPIVFLLCQQGLRGPKDHRILGGILIVGACLRAALAIWVVNTYDAPIDPATGISLMAHATSHQDSVLFAAACLLLILMVVERADKRMVRVLLAVLPLLIWGMLANNRRMVWVQIGLVLFTLYMVTPPNAIKLKIKRGLLWLTPVVALYVAVGWNAPTGIFKPVGMMRSVVEPSTDSSSLWREIENYDLLFTFRMSPFLGHGYGHPFWEVLPLPEVGYDLERYCPHNSVLGLWCYAGFVGVTALMLLWAAGVFFAMRGYFASRVPIDRVAAVLAMGAVIIYMVQCYGDIGLGAWTGVFILGPLLALAGKLAIATGSWEVATPRAARRKLHEGPEGVVG